MKWAMPSELAELYAVHDGLGGHRTGSFAVGSFAPASQVEMLSARIGEGKVVPRQFLAFYCDDVGHWRGLFQRFGDMAFGGYDLDIETRDVCSTGTIRATVSKEMTERSMRTEAGSPGIQKVAQFRSEELPQTPRFAAWCSTKCQCDPPTCANFGRRRLPIPTGSPNPTRTC